MTKISILKYYFLIFTVSYCIDGFGQVKRAEREFLTGNYDEAFELYNRAHQRNQTLQSTIGLGNVEHEREKHINAVDYYGSAWKTYGLENISDPIDYLYRYSISCSKSGYLQDAIDLGEMFLKRTNSNQELRRNRIISIVYDTYNSLTFSLAFLERKEAGLQHVSNFEDFLDLINEEESEKARLINLHLLNISLLNDEEQEIYSSYREFEKYGHYEDLTGKIEDYQLRYLDYVLFRMYAKDGNCTKSLSFYDDASMGRDVADRFIAAVQYNRCGERSKSIDLLGEANIYKEYQYNSQYIETFSLLLLDNLKSLSGNALINEIALTDSKYPRVLVSRKEEYYNLIRRSVLSDEIDFNNKNVEGYLISYLNNSCEDSKYERFVKTIIPRIDNQLLLRRVLENYERCRPYNDHAHLYYLRAKEFASVGSVNLALENLLKISNTFSHYKYLQQARKDFDDFEKLHTNIDFLKWIHDIKKIKVTINSMGANTIDSRGVNGNDLYCVIAKDGAVYLSTEVQDDENNVYPVYNEMIVEVAKTASLDIYLMEQDNVFEDQVLIKDDFNLEYGKITFGTVGETYVRISMEITNDEVMTENVNVPKDTGVDQLFAFGVLAQALLSNNMTESTYEKYLYCVTKFCFLESIENPNISLGLSIAFSEFEKDNNGSISSVDSLILEEFVKSWLAENGYGSTLNALKVNSLIDCIY